MRRQKGSRPPLTSSPAQKLRELRDLRRAQGVRFVLRLLLRWIGLPWWRRAAGLDARRFVYDGREYPYHLSRYRLTWMNERAVEIPLALAALAGVPPDAVLEVGNCTRHYAPSPHRVVDRYEQAPGVENIDVLEIVPEPRYRLVLSISTLEHVGWDEEPREPEKAAAAVRHLARCLAPGGRLLFTVPLGWNPVFDAALASGALSLTRLDYLERHGELEWRQVPWAARTRTEYGRPFPYANGLAIAIHDAPSDDAPSSKAAAGTRPISKAAGGSSPLR